MQYKLNEEVEIVVNREEAHFDQACDAATRGAVQRFGVNEYGHITNVEGAERCDSSIEMMFVDYHVSGGMGGWTHYYRFKAKVIKYDA